MKEGILRTLLWLEYFNRFLPKGARYNYHNLSYGQDANQIQCTSYTNILKLHTLAAYFINLAQKLLHKAAVRRCKKPMQKHVQKRMQKHVQNFFLHQTLIAKFVLHKHLHDTVIRAICDVLESYHSFMQNFTSHKFCDKRLITVWCQTKFCTCFCMGFCSI